MSKDRVKDFLDENCRQTSEQMLVCKYKNKAYIIPPLPEKFMKVPARRDQLDLILNESSISVHDINEMKGNGGE